MPSTRPRPARPGRPDRSPPAPSRSRSRPSGPASPAASIASATALLLGLVLGAGGLAAQPAPCGAVLSGGLGLGETGVPVVTGAPVSPTGATGVVLGAGIICPAGERLRLGGRVEGDFGQELALTHVLGRARLVIRGAGVDGSGPTLSVHGEVGWTLPGAGTGDSPLLLPEDGAALDPDRTSGPALGLGARVGFPLSGSARLFLDGTVRASFLERTVFRSFDPVDETDETLMSYPLTTGIRLTF